MDRERFDAMTRLVSNRQSRRTALMTIIGAAVLGHGVEATGKGKKRRQGKKRRRGAARQVGGEAVPASCFQGEPCIPGVGSNLEDCDFGGDTTTLPGLDINGSNLGGANLAGADATGAIFSGANLKGACLVDAVLEDADLSGAVLKNAVFCRTTMPDGTLDNSRCQRPTRCCPTCIEFGDPCGGPLGGACCDGFSCVGGRCACENDGQCGVDEVCCDGDCLAGECCSTSDCANQGGGFCTPDNECGSCTDACPGCDICFRLTDGDSVCSSTSHAVTCGPNNTGCATNADCPDTHPFCSSGGTTTGSLPINIAFACPGLGNACIAPGPC